MRTTSNPAFRNLPAGGGGYAGFNSAPSRFPGADPRYGGALPITTRPMTVDDVVIKTSITLAVLATAGIATYVSGLWQLALPAA
ncbi:MAG: Bax inhibitor-1/YccA family protein, partial [Pseudonocardiaceae bacterium]